MAAAHTQTLAGYEKLIFGTRAGGQTDGRLINIFAYFQIILIHGLFLEASDVNHQFLDEMKPAHLASRVHFSLFFFNLKD